MQDLLERLIEIASYQWIPTGSMVADALAKKMEVYRDMRTLLSEGDFTLKDKGINKVKCVNGEIEIFNIRNRNNSGTSSKQKTLDSSQTFDTSED